MATKQTRSAAPIGACIENVHIENVAASVTPEAATALAELAKASAAHAQAISVIASALKGSPASMQHGIYLADIVGQKS